MSLAVESLISLGKEIIQTNKDIDVCSKKLFELKTESKLQAEQWNELMNQLSDDEKIQLLCKDIKEQEDKLLQMKAEECNHWVRKAMEKGDLYKLKYFEEKGIGLDLHIDIAAEKGHFDIVKYILSKYNDEETWSECVIHASQGGHLEIVRYCADNNDIGNDAMIAAGMSAIARGHLEILEFIVSKGHIHWRAYLGTAKNNGHQEIIDYCEKQFNKGIYTCKNKDCLSINTLASQKEMKSNDEPATITVTCIDCDHMWNMN